MLTIYQKRKIRTVLHARWFLVLLLIPVAFLAHVAWRAYQGEQEAYAKRMAVTEELASLETRQKTLTTQVSGLDDPRGREAELRLRYDVAKEGERVVVLIDNEKKESASTTKITEIKENRSWWRFW